MTRPFLPHSTTPASRPEQPRPPDPEPARVFRWFLACPARALDYVLRGTQVRGGSKARPSGNWLESGSNPGSSLPLKGRIGSTPQHDVPRVSQQLVGLGATHVKTRNKPLSCAFVGNVVEDRIEWLQWISREIHLCCQTRKNTRSKK